MAILGAREEIYENKMLAPGTMQDLLWCITRVHHDTLNTAKQVYAPGTANT